MCAHVGTVPIVLVREENDFGLCAFENASDGVDGLFPKGGILLAGFRVDAFESVWSCLQEIEAHEIAGALQFFEATGLTFFFAALRDGDVNDAHF